MDNGDTKLMTTFELDFEEALRQSSTNLHRLYLDYKKTDEMQDYLQFVKVLYKYINTLSTSLTAEYDKMFLDTASGKWLDLIIYQETGLTKQNGETYEQFKQRALAYYAFIQQDFTNTNIKTFIETFGFTVTRIENTFDEGSHIKHKQLNVDIGFSLVSKGWVNYITVFYIQNATPQGIQILHDTIETVRRIAISKIFIRQEN